MRKNSSNVFHNLEPKYLAALSLQRVVLFKGIRRFPLLAWSSKFFALIMNDYYYDHY